MSEPVVQFWSSSRAVDGKIMQIVGARFAAEETVWLQEEEYRELCRTGKIEELKAELERKLRAAFVEGMPVTEWRCPTITVVDVRFKWYWRLWYRLLSLTGLMGTWKERK